MCASPTATISTALIREAWAFGTLQTTAPSSRIAVKKTSSGSVESMSMVNHGEKTYWRAIAIALMAWLTLPAPMAVSSTRDPSRVQEAMAPARASSPRQAADSKAGRGSFSNRRGRPRRLPQSSAQARRPPQFASPARPQFCRGFDSPRAGSPKPRAATQSFWFTSIGGT